MNIKVNSLTSFILSLSIRKIFDQNKQIIKSNLVRIDNFDSQQSGIKYKLQRRHTEFFHSKKNCHYFLILLLSLFGGKKPAKNCSSNLNSKQTHLSNSLGCQLFFCQTNKTNGQNIIPTLFRHKRQYNNLMMMMMMIMVIIFSIF